MLFRSGLPWREIGVCIRRFHASGVWHADLNAHNILMDRVGGIWLIDFDRGERRKHGAWGQGNLARLQRSLRKLGYDDAQTWQALLQGYAG